MKNGIRILLLTGIVLFFSFTAVLAQDLSRFHLYHPEADAAKELKEALKTAKQTGRHVFIQIGGNWCIWCARFHQFIENDPQLDSALNAGYVAYHLNYSKENRNKDMMARLGYPQRFGFPVFVILDAKGRRIHTQNSAYLEDGKGYSKKKVLEFFENWSPDALNPVRYQQY
jgi:thioredoxin-related protein